MPLAVIKAFGLRLAKVYEFVFAPTVANTPPVEFRILKPSSFVELSVQVKVTWPVEMAVMAKTVGVLGLAEGAENFVKVAAAVLYVLELPPMPNANTLKW